MPVYQSIDSLLIIHQRLHSYTVLSAPRQKRLTEEHRRAEISSFFPFTPQTWIKPDAAVFSLELQSFYCQCISLFPSSHLTQSWSHLIGQRSCHDHDVSLSGTRSEHDAETIHVITGSRHVHHLHGATRQPEGHWPQRALVVKYSRVYKQANKV